MGHPVHVPTLMQVWSLTTKQPGRQSIVWVGLYYIEAVHSDGYVSGECVCLYCDNEGSYPLYEPYRVGNHTGRFIELRHIRDNGVLIADDGREIETLSDRVL